MTKVDRRSALAIGLAAASVAVVRPTAAQTTGYKDETPWPGVVVRAYDGELPRSGTGATSTRPREAATVAFAKSWRRAWTGWLTARFRTIQVFPKDLPAALP
jgi:hypothetical protein